LRLRAGHGHAGLQLADDVVVLARARRRRGGRQGERQEDLAVLGDTESRHDLARQAEGLRKHAGDLVALSVENDRRADDRSIAAETPRPERVAEDGGTRPARDIVFRNEELALLGP